MFGIEPLLDEQLRRRILGCHKIERPRAKGSTGRSSDPSSVFFKDNPKSRRWEATRSESLAVYCAHGMLFFPALALGDFFAVDADIDRRFDADADLGAIDGHHRDFDVITDS